MKEYRVTLTQDLKEQELKLNQMAADGWQAEYIEHTIEYDWDNRIDNEKVSELYPTEVKTITTFFRYVNKDVTSAEIPDTW